MASFNFTPSDVSRFWKFVSIPDLFSCWEWTGNKHKRGYGKFWVDGRTDLAHRFSWVLHNGQVPESMFICHHCDNPSCVNPSHLFCGTPMDNRKDMVSKNRHYHGERHYLKHSPERVSGELNFLSKLKDQDVLDMRRRHRNGETVSEISKDFDVTKANIYCIVNRVTWKHI